jgi:hypothetical protein
MPQPLRDGGTGVNLRGAVAFILACARTAVQLLDYTLAIRAETTLLITTFVSAIYDDLGYAEANPLSDSTDVGNGAIEWFTQVRN